MLEQLKNLVNDEEAPTAVEYAIMVAGIATAVITVVFLLGTNVDARFEAVNTGLDPVTPPRPSTEAASHVLSAASPDPRFRSVAAGGRVGHCEAADPQLGQRRPGCHRSRRPGAGTTAAGAVLVRSGAAALVTLVLLWTPWTKGRLGGGDVKAMICAATWLGIGLAAEYLLASALARWASLALLSYLLSDPRWSARRSAEPQAGGHARHARRSHPRAATAGSRSRSARRAAAAALLLLWWVLIRHPHRPPRSGRRDPQNGGGRGRVRHRQPAVLHARHGHHRVGLVLLRPPAGGQRRARGRPGRHAAAAAPRLRSRTPRRRPQDAAGDYLQQRACSSARASPPAARPLAAGGGVDAIRVDIDVPVRAADRIFFGSGHSADACPCDLGDALAMKEESIVAIDDIISGGQRNRRDGGSRRSASRAIVFWSLALDGRRRLRRCC